MTASSTRSTRRTDQRLSSEKHVKWSVTVPAHLAEAAHQRVAAGEAPSISALVAHALERELAQEEDELDQLIRDWIEQGDVAISDEHREWARQVLAL